MNPTNPAPMPALYTAFVLLLPLVMIAIIMPLSVRSRRGIVFGITLPLDFVDTPEVRAAIVRFRRDNTLIAAFLVLAVVALLATHHLAAAATVSLISTLVLLAGALVLRAREAARLKPHAIIVPLTRSVDLTDTSAGNGVIMASFLSLLPLAATAFWLRAHWSAIPPRWPQHWNAAGQVNGWGSRTAGNVYAPLVLGGAIVFICAGVCAFMAFAPGTDGRLRRRYNPPLAVLTWLFAGLFSFIALTPLLHPTNPVPVIIAVIVNMLATLAVLIWMIRRSGLVGLGSPGSVLTDAPAYDGTPDSAWHLGVFYFNRADPAVLVPKRFGFGWTLNFGRPIAWVFTVGVVLLLVGSMAIRTALK